MKTLSKQFQGTRSQKGYQFTQLKRDGMKAMYQKDYVDRDGRVSTSYEVFKIIVSPQKTKMIQNKEVAFQAYEVYPSDTHFGLRAWNPTSLKRAEEIYNSLDLKGNKIVEMTNHTTQVVNVS